MQLRLFRQPMAFALLFTAFVAMIAFRSIDPLSAQPSATTPLDRVPADAAVFVHLRGEEVWNHPVAIGLRKQFAEQLTEPMKDLARETGLTPDDIKSVTFHFPKLPQGPGDQTLFVLQVVTKNKLNRGTLLAAQRAKDAKFEKDAVALVNDFKLLILGDDQFAVTHQTLADDFLRGKRPAQGAMANSIRSAREGSQHLTIGFDPSALPGEVFTSAPPELQPFLPLLKSQSILVTVTAGERLKAKLTFTAENADKSIESERAWDLLMKLANDALADEMKNEKPSDELKLLMPFLKDLLETVKGAKPTRTGNEVVVDGSFPLDLKAAQSLIGEMVGKPRVAAARTRSANNLKQIGLAMHNFADSNRGSFPAASICDKRGKPLLSWRVAILPYIEQEALYRQFKLDEPWDSDHNKKLIATMPRIYALPYDDKVKPGFTHYRVFVGNKAAFDYVQPARLPADFPDGTSNTVLVVEGVDAVEWTKPDELEFDAKKDMRTKLRLEGEPGVCNMLFADGSVRTVSKKTSEANVRRMIQRDDGEPIGND